MSLNTTKYIRCLWANISVCKSRLCSSYRHGRPSVPIQRWCWDRE